MATTAASAPILALNTAPCEPSYFQLTGADISPYSLPVGVVDEDGVYVFSPAEYVAGGWGWLVLRTECLGYAKIATKSLPTTGFISITISDPPMTIEHISVVFVDDPVTVMRRKLFGDKPSAGPVPAEVLAALPAAAKPAAKAAKLSGLKVIGRACLSTHPQKPANIMLTGATFNAGTQVTEVEDSNGVEWQATPKYDPNKPDQLRVQLRCARRKHATPVTGFITITVMNPDRVTDPPVPVSYVEDPDA